MQKRNSMRPGFLRFLAVLALSMSLPAWGQSVEPQSSPRNGGDFSNNLQPKTKVPTGIILVKGAWSSASDSATPLPEGGSIINNVYVSQYFGLSYPFPSDWFQKSQGPPPSESGLYVLAQLRPAESYKGPARGTILITAEDMFFTQKPAANAMELIHYTKENLQAGYKMERQPTQTKIAGRSFNFLAYGSPEAELHWYILATQIRCHTVELVLTSRDTKLLESLVLDMNKMQLPAEAGPTAGTGGGAVPVCIKDYARDENVLERVDPVLTEHRFNAIPVRIIIDREGKIKHIHFLTAFPEQTKAITEALGQWKFKPYLRDGQAVEVETGIMFGRAPRPATQSGSPTTTD